MKIERKCFICGKKFWVYPYIVKLGKGKFCDNKCKYIYQMPKMTKHLSEHYNWKGGKHAEKGGYVLVSIGNGKRKFEHRIMMEKSLGRKLKTCEIVHHLNGIRDDNRIENLALTDSHNHEKKTLVKLLRERIRKLEYKSLPLTY